MATDNEALQDVSESGEDELEGLRQEKESLVSELEARETAILGLEQSMAEKDSELTSLKQTVAESDRRIAELNDALTVAVSSYKERVIEQSPAVLAELVTGNTIEEVNESVENARSLMARVRQEMEAEVSRTRVPTGAPQRAPVDLSSLSPREKIQYAVGGFHPETG